MYRVLLVIFWNSWIKIRNTSKVAILIKKMAVGKYENLVTPYWYDLLQPSDKKILGCKLILTTWLHPGQGQGEQY